MELSENPSTLNASKSGVDEQKGIVATPDVIERDAMGRPIVLDGCIRGSPAYVRNQMDLLYPDEANVKVHINSSLCMRLIECDALNRFPGT
jgi:hypothetical protein